jgi:hypothetical protein
MRRVNNRHGGCLDRFSAEFFDLTQKEGRETVERRDLSGSNADKPSRAGLLSDCCLHCDGEGCPASPHTCAIRSWTEAVRLPVDEGEYDDRADDVLTFPARNPAGQRRRPSPVHRPGACPAAACRLGPVGRVSKVWRGPSVSAPRLLGCGRRPRGRAPCHRSARDGVR